MNTSDWLLLEIAAVISAPVVLIVMASLFLVRHVRHKTFFILITFLSVSGLVSIISPIAMDVFNPGMDGPMTFPSANFNGLAATGISVVVIGLALLGWFNSILRGSFAGSKKLK